ncbi:aggregation-promoting factor C-terminal-like domain-containing protein [Kitasatospora kifunensis]|uniref:Outer membrane biosynthesis protein TonB n=1 Tax=Kitasatospora kifunensis TaxID=58351 RepID=A0A7W7VXI9_KITKI|nr:transglycosylase SLT domain-containing protein [Kitasatospora kifunensis]MBB4926536.1 outer membrane biosynthesis protein TonB [Kitasatospora kifunensis]
MRSALMSTVRRRSSVVLASAGLATVCAASAVAFALPSDAATTAAPTLNTHAADVAGGSLDLSTTTAPGAVAPLAAGGDTAKIDTASYLKPNAPKGGFKLTAEPFGTSEQAQGATPAQDQPQPEQPAAQPEQQPAPAEQPAPAPAEQPAPAPAEQPAPAPQPAQQPVTASDTSPSGLRALAQSMVPANQWSSFASIVSHESSWNFQATNPSSGSYGLGQALPASKMASAGSDWRSNPVTQIKWTLNYMNERYGSPNAAWSWWQAHHWY